MAAATSKPFSPELQRFAQGTPFDLHRDLATSSSAPQGSASSSSSFRHRAWPQASGGTDDDFGRFAEPSSWSAQGAGPSSSWMTGRESTGERGMGEARGSRQDGDEIQTLLGSTTLSDAVHADWEAELLAEQASSWAHDINLPSDPPASAQALASRSVDKGKGRALVSGDVSPVSSDLISSLSSLDLNSRSYLKTLLSLPPDEALEDYFSRGTYSDDVYGLPADVQKLFEKAQSGGETKEEGRAKAVRRLGMVMKHLWGGEGGGQAAATSAVSTPTTSTPTEQRASSPEYVDEEDYGDIMQHIPRQRRAEPLSSTTTSALNYQHSNALHSMNVVHQQHSLALSQEQQHFTSSLSSSFTTELDPHSTPYATAPLQQQSIISPSPLRHELPMEQQQQQRKDDDTEREEDSDKVLPPFSQFLQSRLDEMAVLGGRRTPTPLLA
ncbi:hypothetical protein BCR35DRAFT_298915 [Leucosporidium creatinivorum]|uniref:Uncharacterized protein n=1 Tax=Leucosporidium creatinivorum TaxID=106004 RepID=A0A1Y2G587_9BASI|nr:hypothetical protein BCR35DRAFT_298915 [Leucosporidium creatinivorum]